MDLGSRFFQCVGDLSNLISKDVEKKREIQSRNAFLEEELENRGLESTNHLLKSVQIILGQKTDECLEKSSKIEQLQQDLIDLEKQKDDELEEFRKRVSEEEKEQGLEMDRLWGENRHLKIQVSDLQDTIQLLKRDFEDLLERNKRDLTEEKDRSYAQELSLRDEIARLQEKEKPLPKPKARAGASESSSSWRYVDPDSSSSGSESSQDSDEEEGPKQPRVRKSKAYWEKSAQFMATLLKSPVKIPIKHYQYILGFSGLRYSSEDVEDLVTSHIRDGDFELAEIEYALQVLQKYAGKLLPLNKDKTALYWSYATGTLLGLYNIPDKVRATSLYMSVCKSLGMVNINPGFTAEILLDNIVHFILNGDAEIGKIIKVNDCISDYLENYWK